MSDSTEKPVNRDENGKFGKGNPGGGRPKIAAEIRRMFEARSEEAVAGLWNLYKETPDDAIKAKVLMYWIDRCAGKPAIAVTGDDGKPLQVGIGDELLQAIYKLASK